MLEISLIPLTIGEPNPRYLEVSSLEMTPNLKTNGAQFYVDLIRCYENETCCSRLARKRYSGVGALGM